MIKYIPTVEELVRDTKRAGFCTGECGTTEEDCKKCKQDYINSHLQETEVERIERKRW